MKNNESHLMTEISGMGIVSGISVGELHSLASPTPVFPQYWITNDEIDAECDRFLRSVSKSKNQIQKMKQKLGGMGSTDAFNLLDSQLLLLSDDLFIKNTLQGIRSDFINCEWAMHQAITTICQAFDHIGSGYLKERQDDIRQIEDILLRDLLGLKSDFESKIPRKSIVWAETLNPSQVIQLNRMGVVGLVVNQASEYSHAMILARAFKIPVVANIVSLDSYTGPCKALIDGYKGVVYLKPSEKIVNHYKKMIDDIHIREKKYVRESGLPSVSLDGVGFIVKANIEVIDEIDMVLDSGAQGVGLFRSEFLYVDREQPPSMEDQAAVYSKLLKKLSPMPVMIRTVDAGGDKLAPKGNYAFEDNPALGLRAVRYTIKHKKMMEDQIKALIQASSSGVLEVCVPLVTSVDELRKVRKLFADYTAGIRKQGGKVPSQIRIGVMIETPASVLEADLLAHEADFFSLGTNDLVQYVLAVDRLNEEVSYLYSYYHPSVLRCFKKVIDDATQYGVDVCVCGEMAASLPGLLMLVSLGYRQFSMNPNAIPRIKKILRNVDVRELQKLSRRLFELSSYKEISRYWESQVKLLQDIFDNQ